MEMAIARMNEKGRVLIPKNVRQSAGLSKKVALLVISSDNMVFLKKVNVNELHIFDDVGALALASLCPSGERVGVRELLVSSLANGGSMTAMKLYNLVKKSRGRISYQAVWKVLQSLVEQRQIKKIARNKYAINPEWIAKLRHMVT